MKIYLGRHAEPEDGPELDPTRTLTSVGQAQIKVMARFLQTQTDKIGAVLCSSDLLRGRDTGEGIAERLDVPVQYTPLVDPPNDDGTVAESDIVACWKVIRATANGLDDGQELLVISHGPLINALAAWLIGSDEGDKFHFSHGAIMHLDTDDPDPASGYPYAGRGAGVRAYIHWFASAKMMNKAMEEDQTAVIEAAIALADAILAQFEEAKGDYTYDTINVKRSVPDADACELCEDCADQGWIEDDEVFASGEDGPPHHPNCRCELEMKEKRVRVEA